MLETACVTLTLQRSKPSVMSEENQTLAEGVNVCSATNSTQWVDAERESRATLGDNYQQQETLMRWVGVFSLLLMC